MWGVWASLWPPNTRVLWAILTHAISAHCCSAPVSWGGCPFWREFLLISGKHPFTLQFPISFSILLGAREQKERARVNDCAWMKITTGRTSLWRPGSSEVAAEFFFSIIGCSPRPCYIDYSIKSPKFWIPTHIWPLMLQVEGTQIVDLYKKALRIIVPGL